MHEGLVIVGAGLILADDSSALINSALITSASALVAIGLSFMLDRWSSRGSRRKESRTEHERKMELDDLHHEVTRLRELLIWHNIDPESAPPHHGGSP